VPAVLLDTHAWAWTITADSRLSVNARAAMAEADTVWISPISVFEIGQKVRLGKWPEMVHFEAEMPGLLDGQGALIVALTPAIALRAGLLDWPHRDPFDRMLAATAVMMGMDLISADTTFDTYPEVRRVW
jgi:PIN domain nuclease of toxin-antitoxin system